jgi:hypothetical protein
LISLALKICHLEKELKWLNMLFNYLETLATMFY